MPSAGFDFAIPSNQATSDLCPRPHSHYDLPFFVMTIQFFLVAFWSLLHPNNFDPKIPEDGQATYKCNIEVLHITIVAVEEQ